MGGVAGSGPPKGFGLSPAQRALSLSLWARFTSGRNAHALVAHWPDYRTSPFAVIAAVARGGPQEAADASEKCGQNRWPRIQLGGAAPTAVITARRPSAVRSLDTEAVLRAYAIGFFSAALAVLVAAVLLLATQPSQEPGLLWGGKVYETRAEFNRYLKSKGLSYKTWVARNPHAAPWEPDAVGSGSTKSRDGWNKRLLMIALGFALGYLAMGSLLLLLPALRAIRARFAPIVFLRREDARRLPTFMRQRNISVEDVAFGVFAVMTAVVVALLIALLLSP